MDYVYLLMSVMYLSMALLMICISWSYVKMYEGRDNILSYFLDLILFRDDKFQIAHFWILTLSKKILLADFLVSVIIVAISDRRICMALDICWVEK